MTSLFIAGQISVFRITKNKINNYFRKIVPEELIKKYLFYEARRFITKSTILRHRTHFLSQNFYPEDVGSRCFLLVQRVAAQKSV